MKKTLIAVLLFAAPSFADSFGARVQDAVTNPVVVAGAKYLTTAPAVGDRVGFFLSANIPAFRVLDNLYAGGVGANLSSVVPGLETAPGVGVSVPALTYFPKGSRVAVQAGYGWDITSDPRFGGPYVAVGWSWGSAAGIKAKRLAKEAAKGGK